MPARYWNSGAGEPSLFGYLRMADKVLRFETLDADYACLCRRIHSHSLLQRINTSERAPVAEYYTPSLVGVVYSTFQAEIDRLGYRPPRLGGG